MRLSGHKTQGTFNARGARMGLLHPVAHMKKIKKPTRVTGCPACLVVWHVLPVLERWGWGHGTRGPGCPHGAGHSPGQCMLVPGWLCDW